MSRKEKRRKGRRTLVLNADYTAMALIRFEEAVVLSWKDKVVVVDFYPDDYILATNKIKYPVPAVVACKEYVAPNRRKGIPFSRKNVFIRDELTCQYCQKKFHTKDLTYDHVVPRSRWDKKKTPTSWGNIVTACYTCNSRKADKLLSECDMSLLKEPAAPNPTQYVLGLTPWTKMEEEWKLYLPQKYRKIMQSLEKINAS